ncbi:MAG: formylglycine-generating enzyme family protein [Planctomycetota bacterium]|jgi:hypothetical protein
MARLLTLLVLVGTTVGGERERIDALVGHFCNGNAVERRAARDALLRHGEKVWPHFRKLLNHDDPDIRVRARLTWRRIALKDADRWALPSKGTAYDNDTGRPLRVLDKKTGMVLTLVYPGTHQRDNEVLELKRPLYVGVFEVTQAEYGRGRDDALFFHSKQRGRLPMADIELEDVLAFCRQTGLRLPTQQEWEYLEAAGGSRAAPALTKKRAMVGLGRANSFGLHDMRGNVAEWCTRDSGRPVILLGGSFTDPVLRRVPDDPSLRGLHIGFRVVRDP